MHHSNVLINGLLLCDRLSGVHHSIERLILHMDQACAVDQACTIDQACTVEQACAGINLFVFLPGVYSGPLEGLQRVNVNRYPNLGYNRLNRIWHENGPLLQAARKRNIDLFHGPAYTLPLVKPARKTIVTIHDLLALDNPQLCQRRTALYFRKMIPLAVRQADLILTVSHAVKDSILHHFRVPEDKVRVIYHGIGPTFRKVQDEARLDAVRRRYGLPGKFILYLGNLESKKNIPGLIKAFRLLKSRCSIPHKLVLAGRRQWGYSSKEVLEDDHVEVIHTGYIDEADIACVYTLADLFIFPSFFEGFGIPPLEAMACETPVITSNGGALPEITGHTCPAVDPIDAESLAGHIDSLLHNGPLRLQQIARGKQWVQRFCWQQAARETLEAYKMVLEG